MKMKQRYCATHESLKGGWEGRCQVKELSLVTEECVMETVLLAPVGEAKRMQHRLDAYLEPTVRTPF